MKESAQAIESPNVAGGLSIAEHREPLFTIGGENRWFPLDPLELWPYRDLLLFLVWRDVKVRYRQTVLGAAWAILQPLLTTLLFTVLFGRLARIPSNGVSYPVFAYAGLLPWIFFSNAAANASNSLVGNATLISKVYFPRLIIPAAAVGTGLVDFAIGSSLLAGLMIYYGVGTTWTILLTVPVVLAIVLFTVAVGLWMSGLNVEYRDVRYAFPFMLQLWMYVTPVIYPMSFLPHRWRWLIALNPMTGLIEAFRAALFGFPCDWVLLAYASCATLVFLAYAALAFARMERRFADVI